MRLAARLAGFTLGAAIAVAGVAQILVVAIRTSTRTTPDTVTAGVRHFQPTMVPIELGPATEPWRRDASFIHGVDWGHQPWAESIDPRTVFLAGDSISPMGFVGGARTIEADECRRPPGGVGSAIHPADVGARVERIDVATWALGSALGGFGAFVALPRVRRRRP